ncbi:uncharacterized protein LOC142765909 [Rhipicephalus microplus]|uniref:uncharacterized protein LOC142765909 n=1 Tax=Rhipicephalus microplus TaxID=6941 RepID=UPI003F6AACA6
MECIAADPSSSHFMRSGKFTRFCDWRFIHRARLNLLPVNGANPWTTSADKRCRVCGYAVETLPHVLGHCMRHSVAYTSRHNKIVERVKQAASKKFTVTHENRAVGTTNLRPNLVLARGEEAIIVNVTCPFDNRLKVLEAARLEKERKYELVRDFLLRRYQRVTIEAVVVGMLGSWNPANDRVFKKLCSRRYLRLLKKLAFQDKPSRTTAPFVRLPPLGLGPRCPEPIYPMPGGGATPPVNARRPGAPLRPTWHYQGLSGVRPG